MTNVQVAGSDPGGEGPGEKLSAASKLYPLISQLRARSVCEGGGEAGR